jgi:hypothetical protein
VTLNPDVGYSAWNSLLDEHAVRTLLERMDYYEANPQKYAATLEFLYEEQSFEERRMVRKMRRLPWLELEPWSLLWENDVVRDLLSGRFTEEVRVAYSAAFLKPPRIGSRTPYHQDQALWSQELPGAFSCWVALDDAGEDNGCLVLCPGSHRSGLLPHEEPPGGGHPEVRGNVLESLRKESAPIQSGSALVWDRYTVHGSEENRSGRPRRAVVTVFAPGRLLSEEDPVVWRP